jgi:hypothetical protein
VASGVDPGQLALRFLGKEVVGPEIAGKMEQIERFEGGIRHS